jgi:hypothetical protein
MDKNNFTIFGNKVPPVSIRKAQRVRRKYRKRYGTAEQIPKGYRATPLEIFEAELGLKLLEQTDQNELEEVKNGIVIGTIRMGYGHYRMAIAAASAAESMGITPYLLDFASVEGSTASRALNRLNTLYSLGSRLSQRVKPFNRFVWEPITSDVAKKLRYTPRDILTTQLFVDVCKPLPATLPFVSTHPWTSHTAVHAGINRVVTMIPDNYPLAFHLSEGSIHCVQTPSSYIGYRCLKNMGEGDEMLHPIPEDEIVYAGHYVDHEIVSHVELDCEQRMRRVSDGKPRRILLSIGGAGAQQNVFARIISFLIPAVREGKAVVFMNIGEHHDIWKRIKRLLGRKNVDYVVHSDWASTREFTREILTDDVEGLHIFMHDNPFAAVYLTNLLMRGSDVVVTKPSELSFYPVPKLFIQRVGRHEAWGAIRGAELGDGTMETRSYNSLFQHLRLIIEENDLIPFFCRNIIRNKQAGLYDGAYTVIKTALGY